MKPPRPILRPKYAKSEPTEHDHHKSRSLDKVRQREVEAS